MQYGNQPGEEGIFAWGAAGVSAVFPTQTIINPDLPAGGYTEMPGPVIMNIDDWGPDMPGQSVPEPATYALLLVGMVGLLALRRYRIGANETAER
jgi:PEP-CTERM motif